MLDADIDVRSIARTVNLTTGQVYRLIREYNQPVWYNKFISLYYDKLILSNNYPDKEEIIYKLNK